MKKDKDGRLVPFYRATDLLTKVPLKKFAEISIQEVVNVDSSNIEHSIWTKIVKLIEKNCEEFDGFVVVHGTDTMAYTASAVSYALQNLAKPVVFTGSQKALDDLPSDGYGNLINALSVAVKSVAGVFIVFGSKILQGNRATKVSESALDAFDSPMVLPRGTITLEAQIQYAPTIKHGKLISKSEFDPNILVIRVTPGLASDYLETIVRTTDCKGIILEGFGAGNIPFSLLPFLKTAKKKGIPVVVLSQCPEGATQMRLYEVGAHALEGGAIAGLDMTIEATVTKLMWGLAQNKSREEIQELFEKDIAGEVTLRE